MMGNYQVRFGGGRMEKVSTPVARHCRSKRTAKRNPAQTENLASRLPYLRPDIYEQERARIAGQFDEAVRLAEEAFTQQLADCIGHLCERLGREENGNARVFRDSAVTNLTDFFERFRSLSVRSNPQLDALVEQAQQAVRGASPARLRQSTDFRERVAAQLSAVGETLAGMTVERPRRNIQRGARRDPGRSQATPTGGNES